MTDATAAPAAPMPLRDVIEAGTRTIVEEFCMQVQYEYWEGGDGDRARAEFLEKFTAATLTALAAQLSERIHQVITSYGNAAWHQGFSSGSKADVTEIEQRAEDRKAYGLQLRALCGLAGRGPVMDDEQVRVWATNKLFMFGSAYHNTIESEAAGPNERSKEMNRRAREFVDTTVELVAGRLTSIPIDDDWDDEDVLTAALNPEVQ